MFFVLALGLGLRVYKLASVPSGFFADEASIGYNAYSLLATGKDEYGNPFPIFFRSFGDYKAPISIYSTIPFIALFGLTEFSTRLTSVMYGILTLIILFLIGRTVISSSFGILCSFIGAVTPWLIHYDRVAFQMNIYATFFILSIYLFIKGDKNKSFILPAFIVSALTFYTYQPAKLIVPLLLLGLLFIYRKTYLFYKKETAIGFLSFFILSTPLILSLFNGAGFARFNMVSIFSAKLTFIQSSLRIAQNYFTQLSPTYFISGEPTFITRHFVGGLTPLLISTLPFLVIGMIYTLITINKKISQFLAYWLLIYPIAGAVTATAPFTSRSIIGAPLFAIFISLGIMKTMLYVKKFIHIYIPAFLIFSIISLSLIFFIQFYFTRYSSYSSDFWGWQYGARDIVKYFVANEQSYDQLIMAPELNAPEIFFKFYAPGDCRKCLIGLPDNFYNSKLKQLFAVTPDYLLNKKTNFKTLRTIYYPNRNIAFQIGEVLK